MSTASERIESMSNQRLAVELQKLAKKISYHQSWYRSQLLEMAARRLVEAREMNRGSGQ